MRTTLSKRNEIWQLRVDGGRDPVTGKRLQKAVSTGCKRKKDAEEFQKAYLEKMQENGGQSPSEITVRDLFTRWLESMESKVRPGLYFAGEILDIDGLTGGFNLQAAWTTGWIAGTAMAGR